MVGYPFSLVGSRGSTDPLNTVVSWFDNDNQNTDPENDLGGSKCANADEKGEYKSKTNKETIEHFINFYKILYWQWSNRKTAKKWKWWN